MSTSNGVFFLFFFFLLSFFLFSFLSLSSPFLPFLEPIYRGVSQNHSDEGLNYRICLAAGRDTGFPTYRALFRCGNSLSKSSSPGCTRNESDGDSSTF